MVSTLVELEALPEDELEFLYEDTCNEEVELQQELRAKMIEAQQLTMRLQATKTAGSRSNAAAMPGASTIAEDQRTIDIRNTIEWLAAHVNLEQMHVMDVGFEVPIGGRALQLRRVFQWMMPTAPGGKLRLTVPVEHHAEVIALLHTAKMEKEDGIAVNPERLRKFVESWDLVVGEFTTATHSHPEPSVLLAHKFSHLGILVATWPTQEALVAHSAMQTQAASQQAATAPAHSPAQYVVRIGDTVRIDAQGKTYVGTLQSVDAEKRATIISHGARIMAHVSFIRPYVRPDASIEEAEKISNRRRFLSLQNETVADEEDSKESAGYPKKKTSLGHRRTRSSAL